MISCPHFLTFLTLYFQIMNTIVCKYIACHQRGGATLYYLANFQLGFEEIYNNNYSKINHHINTES